VDSFLKGLPDYAIGADIGCGNGKYLGVSKKVLVVGMDRESPFLISDAESCWKFAQRKDLKQFKLTIRPFHSKTISLILSCQLLLSIISPQKIVD
jgi:hypothetical protein